MAGDKLPGERSVGRLHRASSPGAPPASDTGHYKASIHPSVEKVGDNWVGMVGSYRGEHNVVYGPFLEFGTRHMLPRPHWRPASKKLIDWIEREIPDQLAKAAARAKTDKRRRRG